MTNTGLKNKDISLINTVFALHPEIEKVILYGSRAKGNYKHASDIDITLIGEKLTLTIQQKIENELDDLLLPYKIDVSLYDQISNKELIEHIKRVGKDFYIKSE